MLVQSIVAHHVMRWPEAPRSELLGLVGICQDLSGLVGTCWEVVGTCQELLGGTSNVNFMESHFEGIAIVVNKILAKFPIPEILWSVPGSNNSGNDSGSFILIVESSQVIVWSLKLSITIWTGSRINM